MAKIFLNSLEQSLKLAKFRDFKFDINFSYLN